ncbi:MAG TPA: alpha/beta hydrolase-fold protein [Kofleriaceae bacterium]|jgi:predicted alpha/beta superfamily hydrolase|nr:alpha/beta hydrolase-fold protein [Kofleriaceae bacterium]
MSDDDSAPDASTPDTQTGCAPGKAGAPCVLALYDQAAAGCDAKALADLTTELDARATMGPLWADGRALFRTQSPTHVAGTFNDWSPTALETKAFCGSSLVLGVGPVPSGFHTYKLVSGNTWTLDPLDPAFAYDDFSGNPDGKNSVLNTPDSGRGHLEFLGEACSQKLGNCRNVTAYLPAGYDAPATASTKYPVLFMHDGQNVWDDHDCCFGHTGWEVNVTLDTEIAAKRVAPVVVIAADMTDHRLDEYGLDATATANFIDFQVNELQPKFLAKVRGDGHVFVAGSSLGGLISMELALRNPQTYSGIACLSSSFWVGQDDGTAVRDQLATASKMPVAIYLDSGGALSTNADSAADTAEVRDKLVGLGWQRGDSPSCASGPNALCYRLEPGATHDELAWKARAWRFLRFLFPPA